MAKAKSAFVCNDCGADFPKWQGQCGECHAWNTLSEIRLSCPASKSASVRSTGRSGYAGTAASVQRLEDVAVVDLPRLRSGFDEFDRVLGGGFVPGSSILIGGHPGAAGLGPCASVLAKVRRRFLSRLRRDLMVSFCAEASSCQGLKRCGSARAAACPRAGRCSSDRPARAGSSAA